MTNDLQTLSIYRESETGSIEIELEYTLDKWDEVVPARVFAVDCGTRYTAETEDLAELTEDDWALIREELPAPLAPEEAW